MKRFLSSHMSDVPKSELGAIWARAGHLESLGKKIFHFEIGRPDFDTPRPIKDAAIRAMNDGQVHYTLPRGNMDLREAIASDAESRLGLKVDPATEVMVTIGAVEAITSLYATILNPGDEVLVPEPHYPFYIGWPEFFGGKSISVPCGQDHDYQIDRDRLLSYVTDRTKILVINSPRNPTGSIYDKESLAAIASVAIEKDILVISDEVYDRLTYAPNEHLSISTLPGMKERTFLCNSFSKGFAMDGFRIGYCIAPAELLDAMDEIHLRASTCAAAPAQAAAAEALKWGDELTAPMLERLHARRDLMVDMISSAPGLSCPEPQGAFYLWLSYDEIGVPDREIPWLLLESVGVSAVPGLDFGPGCKGRIRLSYASPRSYLENGLKLLIKGMSELSA